MENWHILVDVISSAVTVGWLIVGLAIKTKIGELRLEMVNNRETLKQEMNDTKQVLIEAQLQITKVIEIHIAKDDIIHSDVQRRIENSERQIDRLKGKTA